MILINSTVELQNIKYQIIKFLVESIFLLQNNISIHLTFLLSFLIFITQ